MHMSCKHSLQLLDAMSSKKKPTNGFLLDTASELSPLQHAYKYAGKRRERTHLVADGVPGCSWSGKRYRILDCRLGGFNLLTCSYCSLGSFATHVARRFGVPFIASGDLVRREIRRKEGSELEGFSNTGELVPDEIITSLTLEEAGRHR